MRKRLSTCLHMAGIPSLYVIEHMPAYEHLVCMCKDVACVVGQPGLCFIHKQRSILMCKDVACVVGQPGLCFRTLFYSGILNAMHVCSEVCETVCMSKCT
jgi:hypothetical protein